MTLVGTGTLVLSSIFVSQLSGTPPPFLCPFASMERNAPTVCRFCTHSPVIIVLFLFSVLLLLLVLKAFRFWKCQSRGFSSSWLKEPFLGCS